jgi:transketolase
MIEDARTPQSPGQAPPDRAFLTAKAAAIRREVIAVATTNGAGHIAPSLSCVDLLVALYYGVMDYDPAAPQGEDRDRLIFSKAHGAYALYAILADLGVLPEPRWRNFYREPQRPEKLWGCVERNVAWGLEAGCGSLGHGLPLAVGLAFGARQQGRSYHTFCLMGDGEMQEGTNWEAIQFAVKHQVDNLTLIVDQNGLQAMDFLANVLDRGEDDLAGRLAGFGLAPRCCPGHDAVALAGALRCMKGEPAGRPAVLLARTTKGYGLSCMENVPKFHFRVPTPEELARGSRHD